MPVEQIIWSLAFTAHIGFIGDYNSVHPHIRYTDNNYIVGAFYNSDSRISMYAGYRFELTERAGIEVSATNGYQALGGIVPQLRGTYQTNENIIFLNRQYNLTNHNNIMWPVKIYSSLNYKNLLIVINNLKNIKKALWRKKEKYKK